jgi:hypothetical protein
MPERIYVLVLDWNGHGHTLACLASLVRLRSGGHQVVVIYNGSRLDVLRVI